MVMSIGGVAHSDAPISNAIVAPSNDISLFSNLVGGHWEVRAKTSAGKDFHAVQEWKWWGQERRSLLVETYQVVGSRTSLLVRNIFIFLPERIENYAFPAEGPVSIEKMTVSGNRVIGMRKGEDGSEYRQSLVIEHDRFQWKVEFRTSKSDWETIVEGNWIRVRPEKSGRALTERG
jgi:hypothetical protein